jgi:hypothetical protein
MKKKPNAQDDLAKSQPLLGQLTTFGKEYPEMVELRVEVTAHPVGFGKTANYVYTLDDLPGEYCPCPNNQCSHGGFNIHGFLHELIRGRKTHGETGGPCIGRERMNRRDTRSCYYGFRAVADIKYRT